VTVARPGGASNVDPMSAIDSTDPDFRVCQISFDTLLELQRQAERRSWATRWSSQDALRGQVLETSVLLFPILREEWNGVLRAYRCLILFSANDGADAGALATIDIEPEAFQSLQRIDRDPDVRAALVQIFVLALGGISMKSKE
jgi:hypothetical protein